MKRILYASTLALLLAVSSLAAAQDLGAIARQQRQQKKPSAKKVYTNDDFTAGPVTAGPAASAASADVAAGAADAKGDKAKAAAPAADKDKAASELQAKANGIKAEIAALTRELDIADRENKLRVANYYADAGNSLRDPKKFQDEQRAKEEEISTKKKAIEEARAKLADVVEQGRKAGVKVE